MLCHVGIHYPLRIQFLMSQALSVPVLLLVG